MVRVVVAWAWVSGRHTEYSKLDDARKGRLMRWLKLLQIVPANCPAQRVY